MDHAKKGSSGGRIAVIVAVALVLVLVIVAAIVFLAPDSQDREPGGAIVFSSDSTEIPGSSVDNIPVTEPVVSTAPPPVITDPPATESLPITTPLPQTETSTQPQVYVPSADRNTDFSGCLFIGDSRTQGLMMYSGVRGATAYASRGLMVDTFFTSPTVDMDGAKVSVADAVSANTGFKYVYIMFGVNELGWPYEEVFRDRYAKVVDHVRSAMPDAKIIVQSIIPVTASKSAADDVYNNTRIEVFNSLIRSMCEEKGVTYFDLVPVLGGADGALPEDAAFDGVHLQKPYCEKWLDSLRSAM